MIKHCRCIDCFCQRPVHSVMYYRFSIPVCRINDSECPIRIPRILNSPVKQLFCRLYICPCGLSVIFVCRKCPLCNQSCPFNSMSRCRPIWFKLICRLFLIALQICFPFFCKMFRYPPVIYRRPADNMINNTSCSRSIFFFSHCIRYRQERFHRMHIGI